MLIEHCEEYGCSEEFESSDYGLKTTPKKEYEIVTGKIKCPEIDLLDREGRSVRIIPDIKVLKHLDIVKEAGLVEEEIVSVVRCP